MVTKLQFVMTYSIFLLFVSNMASLLGATAYLGDDLDDFSPPTLPETSGWGLLDVLNPVVYIISNLVWFIGITSFSMSLFPLNLLFIGLNIGMVWAILELIRGN